MEDREPSSSASEPGQVPAPDPALLATINAILKGQTSPAAAHVEKLRTKYPKLAPARILKKLETELIVTASSAGAAAGATGAAPNLGKAAAVALTLGAPAISLPAAIFYILAVAEVHNVPPTDIEHRRKLALSILFEHGADAAIPSFANKTAKHWTRKTLKAIPGSALKPINDLFHTKFVTKTGSTGTIVLVNVLPYVLGAAIGAGYSFVTTTTVIAATRMAFGPPKAAFEDETFDEKPVGD